MPEPPDSSEPPGGPPLSLEPIRGWRTWHLRRYGSRLRLVSITRPVVWPPLESMRSECASCRAEGPGVSCSCGLYAASTFEDLRASGLFFPSTSVVGVISMWGRVVEHDLGARSRLAYPARVRLACAPCLLAGASGVVPTVVREDETGGMVAVCARHPLSGSGVFHSAKTIQSVLLSTYAVELLPEAALLLEAQPPKKIDLPGPPVGGSMKPVPLLRPPAPVRVARMAVRVVGFALWQLMRLAVVVIVLGALLGRSGVDHPSPSQIGAPAFVPANPANPGLQFGDLSAPKPRSSGREFRRLLRAGPRPFGHPFKRSCASWSRIEWRDGATRTAGPGQARLMGTRCVFWPGGTNPFGPPYPWQYP